MNSEKFSDPRIPQELGALLRSPTIELTEEHSGCPRENMSGAHETL